PQAMGEIVGQVKIISERKSRQIVGVHIAGPHATDLIAEGALAIRLGATVEDLAQTIHAHPTLAEAVMEAAHQAGGTGLHTLKNS
ncbi:MAG: dihydrolipoyl dehydrogenase, partial [Desulfobacteraceae bacterium]